MGRYSGSSRAYHSAFRGNNESYFEDLESLTRALVVHPAYVHTLQLRPVDSSGMQTRWGKLPLEVLLNILSFLDSPRDLARLELVNSSCRCAGWRRLLSLSVERPAVRSIRVSVPGHDPGFWPMTSTCGGGSASETSTSP